MRRFFAPLLMVVAAAVALTLAEPPREPLRGPYLAPLLPRAEFLRILGASHISLVTDYFWLQAIQAMGRAGQSFEKTRYLDLYHYATLVTDLDPRFYKVYTFAGNAVPTNLGRETYVNVDEGIELLEKGARAFPDDWRIHYYLASQISYLKKEHRRAAEILERAARMDGAPGYVSELAARLLASTGEFETAILVARAGAASADDPELRELLEGRVLDLLLERELKAVDAAVEKFRHEHARLPSGIQELVSKGFLERSPEDPRGGAIFIREDGRAWASSITYRIDAVDYETRRKRYEANEQ